MHFLAPSPSKSKFHETGRTNGERIRRRESAIEKVRKLSDQSSSSSASGSAGGLPVSERKRKRVGEDEKKRPGEIPRI